MHCLLHRLLSFLAVVVVVAGASPASAQPGFEGWNLEPGVAQAHLVMVARVASISRLAVVETLIQVADSRSRRERATLLVRRLEGVDGVAAVPILSSLRLRADWAAADDRALPSLTRLARDPSTAVRGAALEVLRDLLA